MFPFQPSDGLATEHPYLAFDTKHISIPFRQLFQRFYQPELGIANNKNCRLNW